MSDARIDLTAVDKTKAAFESAKKNLGDLHTKALAVTGALAALGVTAYVAKLGHDVLAAVDQWDELGKAAQRAGFQSAQSMGEFQFAGKLACVETANLESSVSKLTVKMADAASGGKESAAVFKAMGISIKDSNGHLRNTEDVLTDIAGKFASYSGEPEKAALATELFGKAGRELIPLLNGGAGGLQKLREEYRALRGVITDEAVKASEQFNDNVTKLEASVGSLSRSLGEKMLPGLVQITEAMVDQAKKGGTLAAVWAGLKEFWKIGTNSDPFGEAVRNAATLGKQISDKGTQLDGLLATQARGDGNVWIDRRVINLRKEIEALQKQALAASDAVKAAIDPSSGADAYQTLENRRLSGGRTTAPVVPKAGAGGADEYTSLMNRVRERLAAQTAELSAGKELAEQQKFAIKVQDDLANSKGSLTSAQKAAIAATLKESTAAADALAARTRQVANDKAWFEQQQQEQQEADAAYVEAAKARDQYRLAILGETNALAEAGQLLDLEGKLIGATDRERQVALEHLRIELKLRKDLDALDRNLNFDPAQRDEEGAKLRANAAIAKSQVSNRSDMEATRDFSDGLRDDMKGALQRAFEDTKNPGKAFIEAFASTLYTRVSSKLSEAITNALFNSMGSAGGGGAGGLFGKLAGLLGGSGSAGAVQMGTATGADLSLFYTMHSGGVVGAEATDSRPVSPAAFRGAPRFHSGGIVGDEVPIIAKRREGVFTEKQMEALGAGAGAGGPMKLTIVNNTRSPIGNVTERQISPTERALVIEEATERVAAALFDPNSRMSKAMGQNFKAGGRKR